MAVNTQSGLEELGLSANEARLYSVLLELGEAPASEAAAEAGIDRTVSYTVLNRLLAKGLASYVFKDGKKVFRGAKPERLVEFVAQKESIARNVARELERIRPARAEEESVEIVRGVVGVKLFYADVLKEKKDFLHLGYTGIGQARIPQHFKVFERRRIRAGIKRRMLVVESRREMIAKIGFGFTECRFLPEEFLSPQATTIVYGNKTLVGLPSKHEPLLIFITSPDISEMYRRQFNLLWKIAKK